MCSSLSRTKLWDEAEMNPYHIRDFYFLVLHTDLYVFLASLVVLSNTFCHPTFFYSFTSLSNRFFFCQEDIIQLLVLCCSGDCATYNSGIKLGQCFVSWLLYFWDSSLPMIWDSNRRWMVQGFGLLLPKWETHWKLLAFCFGLAPPWPLLASGDEISVSLSLHIQTDK